ncbi:hypothetical protein SEUCBS139899_009364 [Sporothrix eucalyptigena]
MTTDGDFIIANTVLSGILVLPLLFLWIISFSQAPSRKDPARNGVHWLRIAFPFYLLSLIMTVASDGLYIAIITGNDGTAGLFQASNYLSLISGFLEMMATVFTLVAMVEIGLGFLYIQKGAQSESDANKNAHIVSSGGGSKQYHKTVHIALACVGVVLVALALAVLGKACNAYAVYYRDSTAAETAVVANSGGTDYTAVLDRYMAAIKVARDLGASFDIIVWVIAFPLMGFAGYVVHHARLQAQPSLGATVLLLVATLCWFVRFTWHLAYNAAWLLPSSSSGAPIWFDVVDPLLNAWIFFVVLVLLYVLLARRARGLWSTVQPWMQNQQAPGGAYYQPVYNPGGYAPPGPPVGYVQAPAHNGIYQMPANEQPQMYHEMPQPQNIYQMQAPANPQELYAPNQYVQQYQGHPQGSPSPQISSHPTGSTAVHSSPPPVSTVSGQSGTPPNDLKA